MDTLEIEFLNKKYVLPYTVVEKTYLVYLSQHERLLEELKSPHEYSLAPDGSIRTHYEVEGHSHELSTKIGQALIQKIRQL